MSDSLAKDFGAKLTSTLEATMRKAVCDIIVIFEESLHRHQMELGQKSEEVVRLTVKLQAAELKLKEHEVEKGAEEKSAGLISGTNKLPEVSVELAGPTTDVPEVDFKVPEDWCCPLSDESSLIQDEDVCPSEDLRKVLITLPRIPRVRRKKSNQALDSSEKTGRVTRSTTSSFRNKTDVTKDNTLPNLGKRKRRSRGDITYLLRDLECFDQLDTVFHRRRRRKKERTTEEQQVKRRKKDGKITKPTEEKRQKKKLSSQISPEAHDAKYKKLRRRLTKKEEHISTVELRRKNKVASQPREELILKKKHKPRKSSSHKKALNSNISWTRSAEDIRSNGVDASCPSEGENLAPCSTSVKKEPSMDEVSTISHETVVERSIADLICHICQKVCRRRFFMVEHLRVHTGEKPIKCTLCQETFRTVQQRYLHARKWHDDDKKWRCKKCEKILPSQRKREEHELMCWR